MMESLKIKVIDGYHDENLRGRMFIIKPELNFGIIEFAVGTGGVQRKTKYEGRVIPNEFWVEV